MVVRGHVEQFLGVARILAASSPDAQNLGIQCAGNVGPSLISRFDITGETASIDLAIETMVQALELQTENTSKKSFDLIFYLALAYILRWVNLGNDTDLGRVVECHARALSLQPHEQTKIDRVLYNQGVFYLNQFRSRWNPRLPDLAIKCFRIALCLSPDGDLQMTRNLRGLGSALFDRFECIRQDSDLSESIACTTQALLLATELEGDFEWAETYVRLGNAYARKSEHNGMLLDIDKSIDYLLKARDVIPEEDPGFPIVLDSLGNIYNRRFERMGQKEDIETSIQYHSQAVHFKGQTGAIRSFLLSNLASAYTRRFERFRHLPDIDKAIECHAQAIELLPDGAPYLQWLLLNLGCSHQIRFGYSRQATDINNSIHFLNRAMLAASETQPNFYEIVGSLGNAYYRRFRYMKNLLDFSKSIEINSLAISLVPKCHPAVPSMLENLGNSYYSHFLQTNNLGSRDKALKSYKRCSQCITGYPRVKFKATECWAELLYVSQGSCGERLEAYQTAFNPIPQLVWLGTSVNQRFEDVERVGEMAVDAAATAIEAEDLELALTWLEQGRSVVQGQTLRLRTPTDDLCASHPSLGLELQQIVSAIRNFNPGLAGPGSIDPSVEGQSKSMLTSEMVSQKSHRTVERYETLIDHIRSLPGFENFMMPKPVCELLDIPQDGPVVVINISKIGCAALALLPGLGEPVHIPLPNVTRASTQELHKQLNTTLQYLGIRFRGEHRRPLLETDNGDGDMEPLLAELWTNIAYPVLDALACLVRKT
ncbi:hypothetical protein FRC11_005063 [Ceratobasidium sp. 423]|nr:hypothetical protein FRC11_005063 [Ceratobasidium sp. 423]